MAERLDPTPICESCRLQVPLFEEGDDMKRSPIVPCTFCGQGVDIKKPHYKAVSGWEKEREGGGANQITLRKVDHSRVACDTCIRKRRAGLAATQQALM